MEQAKQPNQLIHESSPYLLQHAYNPVDWHPWNSEVLQKAKDEDKMILVSIGYSACHWCHVMEHESFEDVEVARVMNENFICIKVDREERPDVDQVYMDAVQIISGRGGWPLNCFSLPDGRPFWGATYFRRDQWIDILKNVVDLFKSQRNKLVQQAEDIFAGISKHSFVDPDVKGSTEFRIEDADEMAYLLGNKIDRDNGGFKGAPKFPMPNNFLFLLRYHYCSRNPEAREMVELTLEKMAFGGIYDQVGGGFSRYSVDDRWHVPHFEKMLYDNAQLVSLYSEAYRATKKPVFRDIIIQTLEFVKRELTSPEGGFYAALDADSEDVEGKFYVWDSLTFKSVLGPHSEMMASYFGLGGEALWEDGKNVLVRALSPKDLAIYHNQSEEEVLNIIHTSKRKLLKKREERIRPGLDDKILTSWNALMLKAYLDAFRALGDKNFLEAGLQNAQFIKDNLLQNDGSLKRNYKNEKATIHGFLEDYAFLAEAMIALYELTFDEKWLRTAKDLVQYAIDHFYDPETGLFFFTSDMHTDSLARKIEVTDNVIPASNSAIARCLFSLGMMYEEGWYTAMASSMLANVREKMIQFPSAFSNWGILFLNMAFPMYTFVVTGPDAEKFRDELAGRYLPNVLFAGATEKSNIPIVKERVSFEKTRIFVCTGSECLLPAESVSEALSQLRKNN